jgi:hypothetical protein
VIRTLMRRLGTRAARALALPLALALLPLATAAYAAPTWLKPAPVSDPVDPVEDTFTVGQQVAFDHQGNALAVWPRSVGADQRIQASFRPAGGSFSSPVDISDVAPRCDPCGLEIDVAFDREGNGLAVWNQSVGSDQRIQAAFRPVGAPCTPADRCGFEEAQNISAAGGNACCPDLAFDSGGNALVAWGRHDGGNFRAQAAFRPAGGSFGSAQTISASGQDAGTPAVAFDSQLPQGNALAVWVLRNETTMTERTQAAFRPGGGGFGSAANLTDPAPACDCPIFTDVEFDAQGDAVAIWPRFDGTTLDPVPDGNFRVQAAFRPKDGGFGSAQDISEDFQDAGQDAGLDLAVDAQGNALAAWTRSDGTNNRVQAALRPAGGAFGTGVNVSPVGQDACCPQVVFGPQGDAIEIWEQRASGDNQRIQAANRPAGAPCTAENSCGFGAQHEDLSGPGDDSCCPRIARDAEGNAIAAWSSGDIQGGSQQRVHAAAGYDAAGPKLQGLQLPSSPSRTPLSFSVSPVDVWSPIASTTWDFGDGATASGTAVSHAYAFPGSYVASVTSTDAVGNSSSAQGRVAITDTVAPALSGLRVSPRRFRAARRGASIGRIGTRVGYRLSEPGSVRFGVERARRGRRVGRRCRRESRVNRRRPRCTRYQRVRGAFTHRGREGANRFRFTGRLSRRKLRPGAYRLVARATDAAGNRSAARRARFRVARR